MDEWLLLEKKSNNKTDNPRKTVTPTITMQISRLA